MGLLKPNEGHAADPIITRMVEQDTVRWWKKKNLRIMYIWLFCCCMGVEITSGFDSQLIGTLQFSTPFNTYGDGEPGIKPSIIGFMSSCYQLGSILAVPVAPWLSQRYGRRMSIFVGSVIMVIGALLQGFAQHIGMYIIARMLLGFGILFAIVSGSSLIGELAYPKERPFMTSLFNASYFIGSITAAAIAIKTTTMTGNWGWRAPSLLQICPSLLQISTVWLLPESPRWLVSRDRDDDAFAVLVKYHAEGDADSVLVQAEMAQIRSTIKLEMENSKQSWFDMLRTKGMRRRVLISCFLGLFTQMSGNTLLSYYQNLLFKMMGYTTDFAKTRINIANQCWSLANAVIIALVVTRFRRRWMFMLSAGSMTMVFMAMTICFSRLQVAENAGKTNQAAQIASLFFYFSYSPCYNIGNNSLTYTYLVELFPYAQRTMGIGIEQMFGKLAGFFSIYVNPIAIDGIGWRYFAVYCGWITFEFLFVYFMYPETYNRTLEELAFLFEDKDLAEESARAVEKTVNHGHDGHTVEHGKMETTTVERAA
ncbi:major myo-inositol transporter iolT [Stemphylium lycopersici]|uniref:Major myo-inositol transporter iolT n=1 Tax=Stemphylium lycopersici TaxID=183478 RepID=A0A364N0S9_STELY|nr:lactose permease [Stemphylium lycopersici]RAR00792.1 major myo-inositol transporter iolT [Stemphylium lycopersici]RAR08236.1 major myo-inositol transporter iolT [Stemphylium lycopersici]